MSISIRSTTIDNKECLIHLPRKPNGYSVLILGDRNHFVKEGNSLWKQHTVRSSVLSKLLNDGYTVFYFDQGEAHWGSNQSVELSKRLVNYVLKTEIINENIHIFAEGMGSLLAFPLLNDLNINVRSTILFNPCIYLTKQYEMEKSNRFFLKRFIQEMKEAYDIDESEVDVICKNQTNDIHCIPYDIPIRIFQAVYQGAYSPDYHVYPFLEERQKKQVDLSTTFFMPEKLMNQFSKDIIKFYKKNERKSNI
ncbi:hypothetical protein QA612_16990 [Evansella sp. AB-P1]|uniref:hypothetical protein n=1 Tax=Evansella sp. AB-P1 TaxID=3037653 RepID=UPI00241E27F4|nr:hypothetical protein [Evansella sp. AB-P1]MDG5789156.1 hypothetical protein [Evansella sp. AB-P1]